MPHVQSPEAMGTDESRSSQCDGKTPACSQCTQSLRTCGGYESSLIFRDPIVGAHQGPSKEALPERPRLSSAPSNPPRLSPNQYNNSISQPLSWPTESIISLVVQNLTPDEFLAHSVHTFVAPNHALPRVCGAWVEVLPELFRTPKHEGLVSACVRSLAISVISGGSQGRAPMSDAMQAHANALALLQNALKGPSNPFCNHLMASMMCLFLSEVLLPSIDNAAIIHAKGIGDLMELQGPSFFSEGLAFRMFAGIRPVLILHSFLSRQNAFVATGDWNTKPFRNKRIPPLQQLFSEVATLPSILNEVKRLKDAPRTENETTARQHVQTIMRMFHSISDLGDVVSAAGYGQYWFWNLMRSPTEGLEFSNLSAANFFTHLWTFHILCAICLTTLISTFPHLESEIDPALMIHMSEVSVSKLAVLVLRGINFHLRKEYKVFGAASASFPFIVVCDVMRTAANEKDELLLWHNMITARAAAMGYYCFDKEAKTTML
ncbi:hypothetical protein HJFPF1_05848 [Paramyrothecium foliicola]|nr:hypothetical protein HJFPF1_05848 [Paramyrothecium foliicola]